jgi:hypothetical protein
VVWLLVCCRWEISLHCPWNAIDGKHVSIVLGLVTSGMPVSSILFGYRSDSCELKTLGYCWVTQEQFHPNE